MKKLTDDCKAEATTLEDGSKVLTLTGTWYNRNSEELSGALQEHNPDYVFANGCQLGVKPIQALSEQFANSGPRVFIIGADIKTSPTASEGVGAMGAKIGCPPFVRTGQQLSRNLLPLPNEVIQALRENLEILSETNKQTNDTRSRALSIIHPSRVTQLKQASKEVEKALNILKPQENGATQPSQQRSFR